MIINCHYFSKVVCTGYQLLWSWI